MTALPTRRPGDYDPTERTRRRGGPDLISAAQEARRRPGEWVFAGYRTVKESWALDAWIWDVRDGKKVSLGGNPGDWDAIHVLGVMADGEFIADDPDESAVGGDRAAAKFVAYVGKVA